LKVVLDAEMRDESWGAMKGSGRSLWSNSCEVYWEGGDEEDMFLEFAQH